VYKKITISGGTRLYKSELGHYNFVYPNLNKTTNLISDEEVEVLNWIRFSGKTPVKVSSSNLEGVRGEKDYIIMWKD
tara:strand:- start:145 stop:375 length:231 start_codon:yes stop_codon:yes gene_type:complete